LTATMFYIPVFFFYRPFKSYDFKSLFHPCKKYCM
jgi:hypothetical protein